MLCYCFKMGYIGAPVLVQKKCPVDLEPYSAGLLMYLNTEERQSSLGIQL